MTKEQREVLKQVTSKGTAPVRKMKHAQVLLKIDSGEHSPNWPDQQAREAFDISTPTIWRIRQRFREDGLDDALNRRRQPERSEKRKIDGEKKAHVIAVTCSQPPDGYKRWSMRLLADKLIDVHYKDAEKIIVVMDNLNIHVLSSFYEMFDAPIARRLVEKVEIHYMSKHGNWLNMAEIELSILARQCLSDRMASLDLVQKQVMTCQMANGTKSSTDQDQLAFSDRGRSYQAQAPLPFF